MKADERLEVVKYGDPFIVSQLVYIWARNNIISMSEFFELTKHIHGDAK